MENLILDQGYDIFLLNLIPFLSSYKSSCGGEGVAYFIDEKYVVKEYCFLTEKEEFDDIFDSYCKEVQKFSNLGYCVPKIYSWITVPRVSVNSNNCYYIPGKKYYILEERVPGRPLFFGFLEDFYPVLQDKYDYENYFRAVNFPNENISLFREIVYSYLIDYINANELIESLPENVLSKFIVDAYKMFKKGKFSQPDLYPSNIMVDKNDLHIIDNAHLTKKESEEINSNLVNDYFLTSLLAMFVYNESLNDLSRGILYNLKDKSKISSEKYIKRNKIACKAAIVKVLATMNKYLDYPAIVDNELYLKSLYMVSGIIGDDEAVEVMKNVNFIQ